MSVIDTDVEEIIHDEVDDPAMRRLLRGILEWEDERVHSNIRQNKKDALDERILDYLDDQ